MEHLQDLQNLWTDFVKEFNIGDTKKNTDAQARAAFCYIALSLEYLEREVAETISRQRSSVNIAASKHDTNYSRTYNRDYKTYRTYIAFLENKIGRLQNYDPYYHRVKDLERRVKALEIEKKGLKNKVAKLRTELKNYKSLSPNAKEPRKKIIVQETKFGFKSYKSLYKAEQVTGISRSSISKCLYNLQDTAGGYKWSYETI